MISIIAFSLIIFTGSLVAYTKGNRKIMRMVPVSIMGITTILFVFGLAGQLFAGTIVVHLMALITYCVCAYVLFKQKEHKKTLVELGKSYGFVLIFSILICLLNKRMLVHNWDEFSHWADVVKAMFFIDDLATNPLSHSMFKDYPPGMALLQYFFMVENSLISGVKYFVEWRLYAVWHIVILSLLFPFLDDKRIRKTELFPIILTIISICCFYYNKFFESLYIDPVVAAVTAYMLCLIIFTESKDLFYDISVIFGCIYLVLLKDVGMLFACVICLAYLFDKMNEPFVSIKNIYTLIPFIVTFITKSLWKWEVSRREVSEHFQSKINFLEYLEMLFKKNGTDYKQQVVNSAINAFWEKRFHIGIIDHSYFSIFLFTTIITVFVVLVIGWKYKQKYSFKKMLLIFGLTDITVFLYSLSIGAMYAYRFSEYEALCLASYDRYMNICFMLLTILSSVIIFYCLFAIKTRTTAIFVVALLVFILIDNLGITNYISRNNIDKGIAFKEKYIHLISMIENNCNQDDIVCILSRGDTGLDQLALKYYCRPITVDTNLGYSLGGPCFEEDIWYTNISPEDFMNELLSEQVTYVAIKQTGADFIENYGILFENVNDIKDNSLFKVNQNDRLLILCK